MNNPLTYGTVCSGIECMSAAALGLPLKPLFFAEIEPYPCAVLRDHFPHVPNFGDMTQIKYDPITKQVSNGRTSVDLSEGLDILAGGTPCFAAGTLVLTPSGYRPIETLRVGDSVIGGKTGLPRRVEAVGSKMAMVGTLKILGRPELTCTPNHPFYCMDMKTDTHRASETYGRKIPVGDYQKTRADNAVGKYAGRMKWVEPTKSHTTPHLGTLSHYEVMNLVGWYLGDGYIRKWANKNKKAIMLALVSQKKIATFNSLFKNKINFSIGADGKVTIYNTKLANWLLTNFGEHATSKHIPYWVYSDIAKSALLDGYMATDGSTIGRKQKALTVSPYLAYGIADLIGNACVSIHHVQPKGIILGREVNLHDQYTIQWTTNQTNKTQFINGRYASIIRNYNYDGTTRTRVYNLTVATEHAYVTQGIFSFNCQDFSLAGKRAGADGDNCDDGGTTRSSLCFNFIRLLREIRPRFFLYENVPGMLTSNEGRDFAHFLVALGESGYGDAAWRILDAQYVRVDGMERAVPQRRRRVWVVGCLGENHGAAQTILLERDRHQGNTPPRRKTREEIAASLVGWAGIYDAMVEQSQANRADRIFRIGSDRSNGMLSANPLSGFPEVNISPTLDTLIPTPTKAQGGAAIVSQIQRGSNGNNVAPTLDTSIDRQVSKHLEAGGGHVIAVNSNGGDVAPCLTSKNLAGQVTGENERRGGYVLTTPHSFNFELYATPPRNLIDAICARRADGWMVTDSVPTQGVDSYNQSTTGNVAHTLRGEGCLDTTGGGLHTAQSTKVWDGYNTAHTLTTVSHNQFMPDCGHLEAVCIPSAFENHQSDKRISDANNLAPTMGASRNANASNNNPLVVARSAVYIAENIIGRADNAGGNGVGAQEGVSYTLDTVAPHAVCYDGYNQRAHDELCMTLRSAATGAEGNDADPKVCVPTADNGGRPKSTCLTPGDPIAKRVYTADGASPTLRSIPEGSGISSEAFVLPQSADDLPRVIVRRLTPLECERLQGLPDGWTTVDFRGHITDELVADFQRIHDFWARLNAKEGKTPKPKTADWVRQWLERISTNPPDAPRYKACGNGWAANEPRWILFNLLHFSGIECMSAAALGLPLKAEGVC